MNEHETTRIAAAQWAWIPGYEGTYRISTEGEIYSVPRPTTPGGLLKWNFSDRNGYPRVTLVQNGKQRKFRVHILVARTYLGEPPEGQEVRHLNGDSGDPWLGNLAYGTHSENLRDAVEHGVLWMTKRTHCPHGHPYDDENTVRFGDGRRRCRTCIRVQSKRRAKR